MTSPETFDGLVEIGTFRMVNETPQQRAALDASAKKMPIGLYRLYAMRRNGSVSGRELAIAMEADGEPGTWHVLNGLRAKTVMETERAALRPGVVYDAQTGALDAKTIAGLFVTELRHAAEDCIVPGFSLLSRVGDAIEMVGEDEGEISGTLLAYQGDHAILEMSDGKLVALDEAATQRLRSRGVRVETIVTVAAGDAGERSTPDGAALSRELFDSKAVGR